MTLSTAKFDEQFRVFTAAIETKSGEWVLLDQGAKCSTRYSASVE